MDNVHKGESFLKITNVVTYLLFLGADIYTVTSPQPIYGNITQTYFTPSIYALFIWPIIHILLLCTVIYQFASIRGDTVIVGRVSWDFPLMTILFAIFVTAWANHHHTAAFVVSLFLVYGTFYISGILAEEHHLPKSVSDHLFVHLPISVCQAWAIFNCFLAAFEAFGVDATEHQNGPWTNIFVLSALIILQYVALLAALSPVTGDCPIAFIISWILWTVFDHQRSSDFIHTSAGICLGLSFLWAILAMTRIYLKCTNRADRFVRMRPAPP